MKRKIIASIIFLVVFYALFKMIMVFGDITWFSDNACETLTNSVMRIDVSGIVTNKYLDKKSHLHETLVVDNNGKIMELIIPNDKSGFFSFIVVGDSIIKESKSLKCSVIRDSYTSKFELNFGCN